MPADGEIELMSTSHVNYPAVGNLELEQPNEQAKNGDSVACCGSRRVLPKRRWYLPVKFVVEYLVTVVLFLISIPIIFVAAVCDQSYLQRASLLSAKAAWKKGQDVSRDQTSHDDRQSREPDRGGLVHEDDPRITPDRQIPAGYPH
jgi:hypothetical protein